MTSEEQTSQPRAAFCTQMMLIFAQLYENPPKYSLHKQKSEVCKLYLNKAVTAEMGSFNTPNVSTKRTIVYAYVP